MRSVFNTLWILFCILAAAAMIGALLGLKNHSWTWAIVGACLGIPAGWLFARLVSPIDLFGDITP
jgi:hypothetical protein